MNITKDRAKEILGLGKKSDFLRSKSEAVINIFTKAATDLSKINEEVNKEVSNVDTKLLTLNQEREALLDTVVSNTTLINKLKSLKL